MTCLLQIENVKKRYRMRTGPFSHSWLHAVDGVTLEVKHQETLGLVGESGCGKSTLGRGVLGLEHLSSGRVLFDNQLVVDNDKIHINRTGMRRLMQMVFQDPYGSLNPRMTIRRMVKEPLEINGICKGREAEKRTTELIHLVGLQRDHLQRYAHQLSGGQQQRVGLARALATEPRLLVLDEPTSSVDVSVQAQLLHLFKDLQDRLGLSYLFISHDISVVSSMSSRLAVMYLGQIVEIGPVQEVLLRSRHPYTMALMSSVPVNEPWEKRERIVLKGEIGSAIDPPPGCRLAPRCTFVEETCRSEDQVLHPVGSQHLVRCWKWAEL